MSILYTIRCNGCGSSDTSRTWSTLKRAREFAAATEWTHPKPGLDFCKTCSEARAKRAKEENPNGYY